MALYRVLEWCMAALQGEEFHVFIGHALALYGAHSIEGGIPTLCGIETEGKND